MDSGCAFRVSVLRLDLVAGLIHVCMADYRLRLYVGDNLLQDIVYITVNRRTNKLPAMLPPSRGRVGNMYSVFYLSIVSSNSRLDIAIQSSDVPNWVRAGITDPQLASQQYPFSSKVPVWNRRSQVWSSLEIAKRVFRYLKGTPDLSIGYKQRDIQPKRYCDASWGSAEKWHRSPPVASPHSVA